MENKKGEKIPHCCRVFAQAQAPGVREGEGGVRNRPHGAVIDE